MVNPGTVYGIPPCVYNPYISIPSIHVSVLKSYLSSNIDSGADHKTGTSAISTATEDNLFY